MTPSSDSRERPVTTSETASVRAHTARRAYSYLSPPEFEALVGDLLGALDEGRYSRHGLSRDQGVDLSRHVDGRLEVVQVKHYIGSDFDKLHADLSKERPKVERVAPARYSVATSLPLSKKQHDLIAQLFEPFLPSSDRVFGMEDLDQLLDTYPQVETAHFKLWLSSSAVLDALLHAGTYARSLALRREIEDALPAFVQCGSYREAREILSQHRVCLIAGGPGVGKSTLARMLLADAVGRGYQLVHVASDISEAWEMYRADQNQVFYYDDFLGQVSLVERGLRKNEDSEILRFIDEVARSKSKLAVLTTRESILRQARVLHDQLSSVEDARYKYVLKMEDYTRLDRAKILYNHVYFSRVSREARNELVSSQSYMKIIDHKSYTPRLIQMLTQDEELHAGSAGFVRRALDLLDHPDRLWRSAFGQLSVEQQALLEVLVTLPRYVDVSDLSTAWDAFVRESLGRPPREPLRSALRVLEPTFVEIVEFESGQRAAHLHKPAVLDFLLGWLNETPEVVPRLLRAAVFLDQVEKVWSYSRSVGPSSDVAKRRALERVRTAFYGDKDLVMAKALELRDRPLATREQVQAWSGRRRLEPTRITHELRARFLVDLAREDEFADLRMPLRSALEALVARWELPSGDPTFGIVILERLDDERWFTDEEFAVLRRRVRNALLDADTLEAYDALAQLRERWPESFDNLYWEDAATRFREYAERRLEEEPVLGSGIDEIEATAAVYGVDLGTALEDARQREPDPDDLIADDYRPSAGEAYPSVSEDDQIRDLFNSL